MWTADQDGGTRVAAAAAKTTPRLGRPTLSDEELLDRSLEVFLEHGFERTSIDAIAAALGMAKRTIYARYRDKECLFRAAMKRAIDQWIVPVEKLRACETDDLEQTLLRIGEVLMANLLSPAGLRLLRLTNAVSGRMPEIGARNVEEGTEPTLAYLADLLGRRLPRGSDALEDPRQAATAFMNLVVAGPASMASWGVPFSQEAIDRHTRFAVHLFLQGSLPREQCSQLGVENRRLRTLLTDALLANEALRERLPAGA